MKQDCYDYVVGVDTSGQPVKRRMCYCGTTGCAKQVVWAGGNNAALPLTPDQEEKRFYDGNLKSHLLK